MIKYKVQRIYKCDTSLTETIYYNCTLEDAQKLCTGSETSSKTCRMSANIERTEEHGPWFFWYTEDK